MRVGTIIHPLGPGRNDNTRCRAMEKQAGEQSASLPWAMVPHLIPGITANSPKGNAQCGKKKFEDLQIWSPCATGAGKAGVSWEPVVQSDDNPDSNCTAHGHPSPKLLLLPQLCHHRPASQHKLKIRHSPSTVS